MGNRNGQRTSRQHKQPNLAQALQSNLVYNFGFTRMVQRTNSTQAQPTALKSAGKNALSLAAQAWIQQCEKPICESSTGPLAGLSFAVKDNIHVLGLATTAGCPAFAFAPTAHAVVVQKLLQAGASLAGKTNLDQFACGLNGTRSPYGAVPNAFNPAYVSGGSSSGSAYVVATGQVDFALGTDTAGSGRVPAGLNNIVGLKPSKGLVSTRGVVPASQSVDCVSIFARTVAQAASVLQVLAGYDALDPYSRKLVLQTQPWGQHFKFGVPSQLEFYGDTLAQAAFSDAVQQMQALGGESVPIDYAPLAGAASLLYESAMVAERYAAVRGFFDAHASDIIEPVRSIIGKGKDYSAADLVDAQTQLRGFGQQAAAMWDGIDVLLVPTAPTHYLISQMQADPVVLNRNLGAYTNFVNLLDYAAISVPSAIRPDGLPFGITLVGPCGSDWQLAELGQRYHHERGLVQGALGTALPPATALAMLTEPAVMHLAVVGAHLSGMPLNAQLTQRGARLVKATTTAPHYRLYALPETQPPKPGISRTTSSGSAIAVEVWEIPLEHIGSFLALIPPPLGLGNIELADGSWVTGFICEAYALEQAKDVTTYGGWRAYIQSLSATHASAVAV
jgi:allophanate hydrolase